MRFITTCVLAASAAFVGASAESLSPMDAPVDLGAVAFDFLDANAVESPAGDVLLERRGRDRGAGSRIPTSTDAEDYFDGPRGLAANYRRPECTGKTTRIQFGDGSSANVCQATGTDRIFGYRVSSDGSEFDSGLGQGMMTDFRPLTPEQEQHLQWTLAEVAKAFPFRGPGGIGVGDFARQFITATSINGYDGLFYFEPGDTLWVGLPSTKAKHSLYFTLLHELTHLLEENFVGPELETMRAKSWRQRWNENVKGSSYSLNYQSRRIYRFTPSSYVEGFLTGYSRSEAYEDIAVIGTSLLSGEQEVWKCYASGPICKTKVELVAELYGMLSPKYTISYFRSLAHKNQGLDHMVVHEPEDARSLPTGTFSYDTIDDSMGAYRKEMTKPPRRHRDNGKDPYPKGTTPAEPTRFGPDTVSVVIQQENAIHFTEGKTFYGFGFFAKRRYDQAYTACTGPCVERAHEVIESTQKALPYGTGGLLKNVMIASGLYASGLRGVFFDTPGDTIWLGLRPDLADRQATGSMSWSPAVRQLWTQTTLHEITHLIISHYLNGLDESFTEADISNWLSRWVDALPAGYRYTGKSGVQHYSPEHFAQGFLSDYNHRNLNEDVAQFGAALFEGAKEVFDCAAVSPMCRTKINLVLELFARMEPRYDEAHFLNAAGVDPSTLASASARVAREAASENINEHATSLNPQMRSKLPPIMAEGDMSRKEMQRLDGMLK